MERIPKYNLKKPIPSPVFIPEFKSIILIITTHGQIPYVRTNDDTELQVETTNIPEGLDVIKFSSSLCGVANVCSDISVNEYINLINNEADILLDKHTPNSYFMEVNRRIKDISDDFSFAKKRKKIYSSEDTLMTDFRCRYEQGFNIFNLKPHEQIVDKKFVRKMKEKNGNDFSILLVKNKTDVINNETPILQDIMPISDDPEETQIIYFHSLLHKAKSSGVNRLIIFDFSCSTFGAPEEMLNPRTIRQLRNDLLSKNIHYGGRKTHMIKNKHRRKNKSRKMRKYTKRNKTIKH